jgi:FtsZ-interacting cell division protein ZipA
MRQPLYNLINKKSEGIGMEKLLGSVLDPWGILIGCAIVAIIAIVIIIICVARMDTTKKVEEAAGTEGEAESSESDTTENVVVTDEAESNGVTKATSDKQDSEDAANKQAKAQDKKTTDSKTVKSESAKTGATKTEATKTQAAKTTTKTDAGKQNSKATETKQGDDDSEKDAKTVAKVYHISKRKDDGKWQVKFAGGSKAIKLFDTQAEAIEFAKKLADNQDARIVIHKEDGSFRRLTYNKNSK